MIENLRSLAVLVAVVEEGSFRSAGERLGLSPSVISHHISNLEERLDCELLNRTSRTLTLTEKGAVLFNSAREMVNAASDGLDAITSRTTVPSGTLKISVPTMLSTGPLVNLIEEFVRAHPKANVELNLTRQKRHPIDDDFDIVITQNGEKNPSVDSELMKGSGAGFFAAPDLAARIEDVSDTGILRKIPLLQSAGFTATQWAEVLSQQMPVNPKTLNFRLKCDDLAMVHHLCKSGLGLAVLPFSQAAADVASARLVQTLTNFKLEQVTFRAYWAKGVSKSSLTWRFLELLRKEIK